MFHVTFKYLFKMSPRKYFTFLRRALILLLNFWHNRPIKVFNGYKIDLYLPAYPSEAFFYALENKLLKEEPSPVTIVFSMTKACTYNCSHCYQRRDTGKDLDDDLLVKTIVELRDMGVATFDIEGGEPFIHFDRLEKLLSALDARSEIWINTTGAFVTKEKLELLKSKGLFGLMVSIHSCTPEKHDEFVGKEKAFEVACNTAKLCKDLGLVCALNSVLSESEINDNGLEKLMELGKSLQADFIQLIHPKPSGLWLHKKDMQSDTTFIKKIQEKHIKYNSSKYKEYSSLSAQVFEERKSGLACTAGGIERFYINAAGEVQPCEFLNISFGNIKEEGFETVFNRMRRYFKTPSTNWLCCTMSSKIIEVMNKHSLKKTPVPVQYIDEIFEDIDRGEPTKLYKKLGIYKDENNC